MPETFLDYNAIQKILPQKYPFALIDRVTEFSRKESLTALKNITANEWPFSSVQMDSGIFPQTLLIESAAQAALLLYHLSMIGDGEHPRYIIGRIKSEFFGSVVIGDQLCVKVLSKKMLSNGGYGDIDIYVGQEKKATIELIYSVQRSANDKKDDSAA